jgi:FixJ family two-component response regulator
LNGQTPSITVVDNNPRLLQSLENLLESASYAVRMVSSAEDLLNAGLAGVVSEVNVKLHRCNVMRRMQAALIGDLIRAWESLPASLRSSAVN